MLVVSVTLDRECISAMVTSGRLAEQRAHAPIEVGLAVNAALRELLL